MKFDEILGNQVLILDGAMGTSVQSFGLGEEDFRGERFKDHAMTLKGNNDLLVLSNPSYIETIYTKHKWLETQPPPVNSWVGKMAK